MSTDGSSFENAVAKAVIEKFNTLPLKSKPKSPADGICHWVPLSGIVLSRGAENDLRCIALGTGMKCLPAAKVPGTCGYVLHDWHAEVLAIRAFNRFLLQECQSLLQAPDCNSVVIQHNQEHPSSERCQPFALREDVKIHMYSSEAPCGDASMELVMNAQDDPTPWPISIPNQAKAFSSELRGREHFSELGTVRRKPARGDSLQSLSKSCSDKLALKQCISLLNSNTVPSICPDNVYLNTLILPETQYVQSGFVRAFGPLGRMRPLVGKIWPGGFKTHNFEVHTTEVEFEFSRRRLHQLNEQLKGSNISTVWTPYFHETLINGVLQGRKQLDPKGASKVSRQRMRELSLSVVGHLNEKLLVNAGSIMLGQRRVVKDVVTSAALTGWIPNCDDGFSNSRR